jgi:hypothetical protein
MSQFVQLFTKPAAKKKVERIAKLDRRTLSETVDVIADEALARRLAERNEDERQRRAKASA